MPRYKFVGAGMPAGAETSDVAPTENVSVIRAFARALLQYDGSVDDIQLIAGGKILPDEPVLNFMTLKYGGVLMVRLRVPNNNSGPQDGEGRGVEAAQSLEERCEEPQALQLTEKVPAATEPVEWWLGLPDAAPCRFDESLQAFLCEPCLQNEETGVWEFNQPGSELASSLNNECPLFCNGRWLREYYISEEDWAAHKQRGTRISFAFRFPKENPLDPSRIRYDGRSETRDAALYPRFDAVQVRPPRDEMKTLQMATGNVLIAERPPKKGSFRTAGDHSILLLDFDDTKGLIRPGMRVSLLECFEPKPKCVVCHIDKGEDEDAVFCDECGDMYHYEHCEPPLTVAIVASMGDEEWFCHECRNVKTAGHVVSERMAATKVAKAAEKGAKKGAGKSNQAWRDDIKKTSSPDRTGHVFGTMVGQHVLNRTDFAIRHVHFNHMSSFKMSQLTKPPFVVSVCLSSKGDYDMLDTGDVVCFDGPGGRNLSGTDGEKNARTGVLEMDQHWQTKPSKDGQKKKSLVGQSGANMSMARASAAFKTFMDCPDCRNPFFGEDEFSAKPYTPGKNAICETCQERYREGTPVRLVRGATSNAIAPNWGYRYDGLYYVRQFWTEEREPPSEPEKKRRTKKTATKKNGKDDEEKEKEEEKVEKGKEEEEEEKPEKKAADGPKTLCKVCCFELVRHDPENPAPWTEEGKALATRFGLDLPPRSMYRKKIGNGLKLSELHKIAETIDNFDVSEHKKKSDLFEAIVAAGKVGDFDFTPDDAVVVEDFERPPVDDTKHPAYLRWQTLWRADDDAHREFWENVEKKFISGEYTLRDGRFFDFTSAVEEKFSCSICTNVGIGSLEVTPCCTQVICSKCTSRSSGDCPFCRAKSPPVPASKGLRQLLPLIFEYEAATAKTGSSKKASAPRKKKAAPKKKPREEEEEEEEAPSNAKRAKKKSIVIDDNDNDDVDIFDDDEDVDDFKKPKSESKKRDQPDEKTTSKKKAATSPKEKKKFKQAALFEIAVPVRSKK